jgi:hypothetical protein
VAHQIGHIAQDRQEMLDVKRQKTDAFLSFIQREQGKDDAWKERVKDLTIVRFMRRITGYKRFDLINEILTDSSKLDEFLNADLMFILGGRVHQEDQWARDMVNFLVWLLNAPESELVDGEKINLVSRGDHARYDMVFATLNRLVDNPALLQKLRDRVIFFPNYNIYDAPVFVQGAHATVMMADKGQEAAATGFQKDQMNGSLVLAVGEEGAIDESVYFSQVERLELLAATLSQANDATSQKELAALAGNGFEIPSNGSDVYKTGKRTGPTARGLLDALKKLDNVRKGRTPLGASGHPEIYSTMMRNAIRTTEQVSVERTAKDMLVFMSNLVRHAEHETKMYDLGVRQARYQHKRRPQLREQLLNARDGQPFEWSYLDGKVRHQTIYRHQGPVGHEFGILNFIEGFHQVVRMGRLGRWSILYHAADPSNNDLFRYVWHLVNESPDLKKSTEFIETLRLLELEMQSVATPILELESTISGLQDELSRATDRTLVKALQGQLTEAQDQLSTSQDALIGQVYYLIGFLEGSVRSASELRPRTLEAIKDMLLPMGAFIPVMFFPGMTDVTWKALIGIGIALWFVTGVGFVLGFGLWLKYRDRSPVFNTPGYANRLRWNLQSYDQAKDELDRANVTQDLYDQLAPVRKMGVQNLGRLLQGAPQRRAALYEIYLAIASARKSSRVNVSAQLKSGDVNLIIMDADTIEEIHGKLEGVLKTVSDETIENKVLLPAATYAKFSSQLAQSYSRFTFHVLTEQMDVKVLASRSDRQALGRLNVLFENSAMLPSSFVEALYALGQQDPAFRDRVVLYYLKQGFLAASAFVIKLEDVIGFATLAGSQA